MVEASPHGHPDAGNVIQVPLHLLVDTLYETHVLHTHARNGLMIRAILKPLAALSKGQQPSTDSLSL